MTPTSVANEDNFVLSHWSEKINKNSQGKFLFSSLLEEDTDCWIDCQCVYETHNKKWLAMALPGGAASIITYYVVYSDSYRIKLLKSKAVRTRGVPETPPSLSIWSHPPCIMRGWGKQWESKMWIMSYASMWGRETLGKQSHSRMFQANVWRTGEEKWR